jgi:hypothetical protein
MSQHPKLCHDRPWFALMRGMLRKGRGLVNHRFVRRNRNLISKPPIAQIARMGILWFGKDA